MASPNALIDYSKRGSRHIMSQVIEPINYYDYHALLAGLTVDA